MADINTTLDALRISFARAAVANDFDPAVLDPAMPELHANAIQCAQEIAKSVGNIQARYLAVPANADVYYAQMQQAHARAP